MRAISTIFKAGQKLSPIPILRAMYPALRFIVAYQHRLLNSFFYHLICIWVKKPAPNDGVTRKASAVMNRIGTELLNQSKGDDLFQRKDVLSILAQANSMEEKAHQMKDEDVKSRA